MNIAEKILRAKADLDSVYDAGVEKGKSEAPTGAVIEPLEVAANGTYTAPNGVAYSPVKVNVPDVNGSYDEGYEDGYEDGKAEGAPEDLNDVLTAQEEKLAELSAILDRKASGGGNNNLKEYFEGTTTDLYWADLENINNGIKGNVTSINFPAVKIIGDNAFNACAALKSVTIDSVTNIGVYAFSNCSQLVEMRFPASLLEIKSRAFSNCTALSSVTFDGKPHSISVAFSSCTNLTTINVPWSQGEVDNAPWGASNATINYNYKGE